MAPLKKTASNVSSLADPGVPHVGPGGPIEVAFTFDTTGSMYRCLAEVRQKLRDVIQRLFADIPNLRIAVFAHGDYCDSANYVTKYVDFTNDVAKLCDFVQKVKATSGGDFEECYELVLRQTRELLSWRPGSQRALVMIGDAIPHPASDPQNKDNIDWEEEADKLRDQMGVRVYAVQAYQNPTSQDFWSTLAKKTFGKHLNLGELGSIVEMMMAICYREHGAEYFEAYEKEVRAREGTGLRRDLSRMFDTLRDGETPPSDDVTAPVTAPSLGSSKGGAKRTPIRKVARPKATVFKAPKKTSAARRALKTAAKTAREADDGEVRYSLSRQFRETVPESSNQFKSLDWSSWRVAMAPTADREAKPWTPRAHGDVGVRNSALFGRRFRQPAVYEVAVQLEHGQKMYPVYVRSSAGFSRTWDSYLMRNSRVRELSSAAIQKGCKVFMRRTKVVKPVKCDGEVVSSVRELRDLMTHTYDYAWLRNSQHGRPRKLTRKGVTISQ